MSRIITRKPVNDTILKFAPMGQKPNAKKPQPADKETAADAKKPGDKQEDAADQKGQKTAKKSSAKSASFYAKKAASALANSSTTGNVGKQDNASARYKKLKKSGKS